MSSKPTPPRQRSVESAQVSPLSADAMQSFLKKEGRDALVTARRPFPAKLHLVFARKTSLANQQKPIAKLHPEEELEAVAPKSTSPASSSSKGATAHTTEAAKKETPPVRHQGEAVQPAQHDLTKAEEHAADYLALHTEIPPEVMAKKLKWTPVELAALGEKLRQAGLLLGDEEVWRPAPDFRSDHQLFGEPNRYLLSLFERVADTKLRESWMAALQATSPLLPGVFGNTKTQLRRFDGKKLLWKLCLNKKSLRLEIEAASIQINTSSRSLDSLAPHLKEEVNELDFSLDSSATLTFISAPPAGHLIPLLLNLR